MLAKVFQSGNSQAVRLPKALRFNVNEVDITKEGDNLIMKPIKKKQPSVADALMALMDMPDDFMIEGRGDTPPIERESLDDWLYFRY